jgi:NodT family efflux transporter outer membrane factor (OMF) lipoprotein
VTHNPKPPVVIPQSYGATSAGKLPEQWWRDFRDPDLDKLVERSLRDNLQLRAAWARVRQARAVLRQASSGKWPQIDASASATRRKLRFDFGDMGVITPVVNTFTVSASAAYEVDMWKRIGNGANAARLDALAVRDDVAATAIGLAADITDAWWDLVLQRARRKLMESQLKTSEQFLELTKLRFQQGMASALDVHQQNRALIGQRAQLALVDAAVKLLEHRLALLVGQPPRTVVAGKRSDLPELPPLPGTGIPADLLQRRPDVRAARRRVEAADYRVAVAVADRLPALRLSAESSVQDSTIGGLFTSPLYALFAGLTAPLFDGGRRKAEVERNKAVVEERLLQYGQVLLLAITEVENALVQEKQQRIHIADLKKQVEVAKAALREARERYRAGLTDYLVVLTSLQALQNTELGLLNAERQALAYRVALCRALGGTWTRKLAPKQNSGGSK